MPVITSSLARADRWACRGALLLEALVLAWTGGRVAAGGRDDDLARLVLVAAISLISLALAVTLHGRTLFLGEDAQSGRARR